MLSLEVRISVDYIRNAGVFAWENIMNIWIAADKSGFTMI